MGKQTAQAKEVYWSSTVPFFLTSRVRSESFKWISSFLLKHFRTRKYWYCTHVNVQETTFQRDCFFDSVVTELSKSTSIYLVNNRLKQGYRPCFLNTLCSFHLSPHLWLEFYWNAVHFFFQRSLEFSILLLKDRHFVLFAHIEMESSFLAKAESGIFGDTWYRKTCLRQKKIILFIYSYSPNYFINSL